MPDFIPVQGTGQQENVQPAPQQFITPQQGTGIANTALQAQEQPEAPSGVPVGAGSHAVEGNPAEAPEEAATPEEEAQYKDLFIRTMAAVNDTRTAPKSKRSLADQVIRQLSTKDKEAYVAIGDTAGLIMSQMVDNAKRQKVEYENHIIQQVGMDLVVELMRIAEMSGAIKDMPKEDTPEYDKLGEMAVLQAAKWYGEYQIKTGQADQQGSRQELDEQMLREADSGALDEWGMEEMEPGMRGALGQQVAKSQGA